MRRLRDRFRSAAAFSPRCSCRCALRADGRLALRQRAAVRARVRAVVALTHVRVVDGTGAPPLDDQTIVIENGTITRSDAGAQARVPAGARTLDLTGHTVIPGIVGMHDHTFYTTRGRSVQLQFSAPRLYLAAGVTTIRTTGGTSPYHEINMKRNRSRQDAGPAIHLTGPYLTGPGGAATMAQVATPEEARRIVDYWADEGVTWFKAYTDISRAALGAAIDQAHKRGLKFTGHLCSVSFREAVELGIDTWSTASSRTATTWRTGRTTTVRRRCGPVCCRSRSTVRRCSRRFARWSRARWR